MPSPLETPQIFSLLREDFMTPGEVRRTYFPTREEAEEECRKNGKAWLMSKCVCPACPKKYGDPYKPDL